MSEQRRFEIMRRDFVTNVSHELKTPAGAISLLAETIGDAADDPDAVKYFSGRISKESERLTELVHRLIDLQKAQSAAAMLNAERCPCCPWHARRSPKTRSRPNRSTSAWSCP